jgi:hypothetical protein
VRARQIILLVSQLWQGGHMLSKVHGTGGFWQRPVSLLQIMPLAQSLVRVQGAAEMHLPPLQVGTSPGHFWQPAPQCSDTLQGWHSPFPQ